MKQRILEIEHVLMFHKNSVTRKICCNAYVCLSNDNIKIKYRRVCNIILSELSTVKLNRKNYSI